MLTATTFWLLAILDGFHDYQSQFDYTYQWQIQGVSPFEIDLNPGGWNTLIEQSDQDSLIEQSGQDTLSTVRSYIRNTSVISNTFNIYTLLREEYEG